MTKKNYYTYDHPKCFIKDNTSDRQSDTYMAPIFDVRKKLSIKIELFVLQELITTFWI